MLDIAFARPALPKSGALVLLACEGEHPSGLWQQADEATGGAIARAFKAAEFKGAKGKTCVILAPGAGLARVIGGGPRQAGRDDPAEAERGRRPRRRRARRARPPPRSPPVRCSRRRPPRSRSARCCAPTGSTATAPRKSRRTSRSSRSSRCSPTTRRAPRRHGNRWRAWPKGVFLSRDLVSEPPNVLNPAEMAERCRKLTELGLKVEVLGPKEMGKLGFRRVARRGAGQRERAAHGGDAVERRRRATAARARPSRSRSSARASRSTPAASASSRPAAWRT